MSRSAENSNCMTMQQAYKYIKQHVPGVGIDQIKQLVKEGVIKTFKPNKQVFYLKNTIDAYLDSILNN